MFHFSVIIAEGVGDGGATTEFVELDKNIASLEQGLQPLGLFTAKSVQVGERVEGRRNLATDARLTLNR